MTELEELVDFLSHPTPQIKQHAAELVEGLTGSPEGIAQLSSVAERLLPALLRLISAEAAMARSALTSLVNLAQEPASQLKLLELNAVGRCMDYIREANSAHPQLLVMLLANLTAAEQGAEALVQLGKQGMEGLNVAMLLKRFLAPIPQGAPDDYEHVATILPNVTRFQTARKLLLEPGRGTLQALASQLLSPSELRRRGSSGAIKNCCMGCEEDDTVDIIVSEKEALSRMLSVLCGVEEPEKDAIVRGNLAEAVLCLAKAPDSRKKLWECDAPNLLKQGYELEEDPVVCEAMEKTAELFMNDGFDPDGGATEDLVMGAVGRAAQAGGGMVTFEELD